jgi:hypothetical protein
VNVVDGPITTFLGEGWAIDYVGIGRRWAIDHVAALAGGFRRRNRRGRRPVPGQ